MRTPEVLSTAANTVRDFVTRGQRERKWRQKYAEQEHLEFLARRLFNRGRLLAVRHSDSPLSGINVELKDGSSVHLSFGQIYTSTEHGILTISVKGEPRFLKLQMDPIGLSGGTVSRADLKQPSLKVKTKLGLEIEKPLLPPTRPITQEDYDHYRAILDGVRDHFKVKAPDIVK